MYSRMRSLPVSSFVFLCQLTKIHRLLMNTAKTCPALAAGRGTAAWKMSLKTSCQVSTPEPPSSGFWLVVSQLVILR